MDINTLFQIINKIIQRRVYSYDVYNLNILTPIVYVTGPCQKYKWSMQSCVNICNSMTVR